MDTAQETTPPPLDAEIQTQLTKARAALEQVLAQYKKLGVTDQYTALETQKILKIIEIISANAKKMTEKINKITEAIDKLGQLEVEDEILAVLEEPDMGNIRHIADLNTTRRILTAKEALTSLKKAKTVLGQILSGEIDLGGHKAVFQETWLGFITHNKNTDLTDKERILLKALTGTDYGKRDFFDTFRDTPNLQKVLIIQVLVFFKHVFDVLGEIEITADLENFIDRIMIQKTGMLPTNSSNESTQKMIEAFKEGKFAKNTIK